MEKNPLAAYGFWHRNVTLEGNLKRPNLFIIGAPKCGTTSLVSWLSTHPAVFVSPVKEPHYFNTDEAHRGIPDLERYERLFTRARDTHVVVTEASVWYLFSKEAVKNTEKYSPDSKYIVCLRNPVDMAYSMHEQNVVSGVEDALDFEAAWALQDARRSGRRIPRWCREPRHLLYGEVCSLGAQMTRLLNTVDRERVLWVVLDDVKNNARVQYLEVLRFLGIPDDGRVQFPARNSAKERPIPALRTVVGMLGEVKRRCGFHWSLGLLNAVDAANIRYRERQPMGREIRKQLQAHFAEDVTKLSEAIDRDMTYWVSD